MYSSSVIEELEEIIEKITPFCCWETTRDKLRKLEFETHPEILQVKINKVSEFSESYKVDNFFMYQSEDISDFISDILVKGNILSSEEIKSFFMLFKNIRAYINFFKNKPHYELNNKEALNFTLSVYNDFYIKYKSFFSENGDLIEDKIPHVASLSENIRKKREEITNRLNSFINSNNEILSDTFYKHMEGRYLLPYSRAKVTLKELVIHDFSDSGQTVYAEPIWLVDMNNSLRENILEKERLIKLFFREISEFLCNYRDDIKYIADFFSEVDELYSKGRFMAQGKRIFPEISNEIKLFKLKNPLLDYEKSVPADVFFPENKNIFLVSGPNAGGKTVLLKSLFYTTVMVQMAIPVFCEWNSKIKIFNKIFDIFGDESSILNSMSTFSYHMKKLAEAIEQSDENTLILIDEIASGTDPDEGGAIAASIMEHLAEKNAKVIVSTHIGMLKYHFYKKENVQSVSLAFDTEKSIPLYKVEYNSINSSFGFEIARKSGISEEILSCAKKYKNKSSYEVGEFLKDLACEKTRVIELSEKLEVEIENSKKEKEKYENYYKKIEEEMRIKLKKELDSIEREFSKYRTQALDKLETLKTRKDIAFFNEPALVLSRKRKSMIKESEKKYGDKLELKDIKKGINVFVISLNDKGKIVEIKENRVKVNIDGKNIETGIEDLYQIKNTQTPARKKHSANIKTTNVQNTELRLLGFTVEEALVELERFIEKALMQKLSTFRVVHGKGIVREHVKKFLTQNSKVESAVYADYYSGQDGVSIVKLK